jgi:plasmid stability protein
MTDILIRNLDKRVAARLKRKAAVQGKSVSEVAREALASYVQPSKAEVWERARRLRAKIGKVSGDSTQIIREWRDNTERYR